jgi:hypothetical protein
MPDTAPTTANHNITTSYISHPNFKLQVSCSCGATLYAVNETQAKDHEKFHLDYVKRLEALKNGK